MTLRKLSAAVLASVVASGAMAQGTDTTSTTLNLTVNEIGQVLFEDATMNFAANAGTGASLTNQLCVSTTQVSPSYDVSVSSTNGFSLVGAADNTRTIGYTATLAGVDVTTGTFDESNLTESFDQCNDAVGAPTFDNALAVTLNGNAPAADTYGDTITVTIAVN